MSLAAESGAIETDRGRTAAVAEPLVFRSLENGAGADAEAAAAESVPAEPAFDLQASLDEAREQGRRDAVGAVRADAEQRIEMERDAVRRSVQQFEEEKQRYFADVEQEVVKLALAIAERVLRRESNMDPTFLAGAARVALDQVADSSDVVLRVSAGEADRWTETMKSSAKSMVIEPDAALDRGECVLKTRSGTVQLGLRAQLQEIERGFFELLGRRPLAVPGAC